MEEIKYKIGEIEEDDGSYFGIISIINPFANCIEYHSFEYDVELDSIHLVYREFESFEAPIIDKLSQYFIDSYYEIANTVRLECRKVIRG